MRQLKDYVVHVNSIVKFKEQYINSLTDINFYTESDKELYYSVHSISPISFIDEEGISYEVTPPKIHGTLAAKKSDYI